MPGEIEEETDKMRSERRARRLCREGDRVSVGWAKQRCLAKVLQRRTGTRILVNWRRHRRDVECGKERTAQASPKGTDWRSQEGFCTARGRKGRASRPAAHEHEEGNALSQETRNRWKSFGNSANAALRKITAQGRRQRLLGVPE